MVEVQAMKFNPVALRTVHPHRSKRPKPPRMEELQAMKIILRDGSEFQLAVVDCDEIRVDSEKVRIKFGGSMVYAYRDQNERLYDLVASALVKTKEED